MKLVDGWKKVLYLSSSLWAVYGGAVVLLVDKAPGWLQGDMAAHVVPEPWRSTLVSVALALAAVFRVVQQEKLRRATAAAAAAKGESAVKELDA